ncbi:hypothetical protein Salmuc_01791 [Salipiger mucosus DSM 16094]|uniref:Uncharacterized protein n=1 Tax=Salipiger mucosus DSM 16094 TaxID=1123237 RepID=S9QRK0_9RHOB|nr:hypothetical protein Salmuc_01791 [Salipiger mucosus DSM 16094]
MRAALADHFDQMSAGQPATEPNTLQQQAHNRTERYKRHRQQKPRQ